MHEATKDLIIAVWDLRDRLRREYTEKAEGQATKTSMEAKRKIEKIAKNWKRRM